MIGWRSGGPRWGEYDVYSRSSAFDWSNTLCYLQDCIPERLHTSAIDPARKDLSRPDSPELSSVASSYYIWSLAFEVCYPMPCQEWLHRASKIGATLTSQGYAWKLLRLVQELPRSVSTGLSQRQLPSPRCILYNTPYNNPTPILER